MFKKPAKETIRESDGKRVKPSAKSPVTPDAAPPPENKQPERLTLEMLYSDSMFDSCW